MLMDLIRWAAFGLSMVVSVALIICLLDMAVTAVVENVRDHYDRRPK